MMSSILLWIVPNRIDRQIVAVVFVFLMAVGITTFSGSIDVDPGIRFALLYCFFGALFSVPATIGTQSWTDIRQSIPLLLLTQMSLGLIVLLVDWDQLWNPHKNSFNNPRSSNNTDDIVLNYAGLSIVVIAYFGTVLVSLAFSRVADKLLEMQTIRKQNRVRLLIYFVVFLFVSSQLQKLLDWYPVEFTPVLMMISGAVLIIPVTYLLCRLRRWWVRSLVFLMLFGTVAILLFSMQSLIEARSHFKLISMLAAPIGYFIVLMLIWRPVSTANVAHEVPIPAGRVPSTPLGSDAVFGRKRSDLDHPRLRRKVGLTPSEVSRQQATVNENVPISDRRWPSLWGLGAIVTAILIVVASSLVDLLVAFQFGGSDGLELARFVRRLQQTSGVDTHRYHIAGDSSTLAAAIPINFMIMAGFSPKSDPNYFASFSELKIPVVLNMWLHNLNPNLETDGIKGVQKQFVSIEGGSLSTQQLLDLINGSQYVYLSGCQFENSGNNPMADPNQTWPLNIHLYEIPTGQVAVAVNALQVIGFNSKLYLSSCKLNDDDWRAIAGLKNATAVSIQDCSPPTSIATRKGLKEKLAGQNTIQLQSPHWVTSPTFWSYFDLNIPTSTLIPRFKTDEETWDALFVGGLKLGNSAEFLAKLIDSGNFKQNLVDFHLVFDPDKNPDAIRYVLIPMINNAAIEKAASLTELEILSFDVDWFDNSLKQPRRLNAEPLNWQPLENLRNLKELYFPKTILIDNFQVFAKLPDLEILQFDAFHDNRLYRIPNVKADYFPNLKQIRLFSEPHPKLLLELAKLQQLERVDMINSEEWFEKVEDQEKLKSIFDQRVEIRFLKEADYPDPPESFRQHYKQVDQDVRKRRIPDSE